MTSVPLTPTAKLFQTHVHLEEKKLSKDKIPLPFHLLFVVQYSYLLYSYAMTKHIKICDIQKKSRGRHRQPYDIIELSACRMGKQTEQRRREEGKKSHF